MEEYRPERGVSKTPNIKNFNLVTAYLASAICLRFQHSENWFLKTEAETVSVAEFHLRKTYYVGDFYTYSKA